MVAQELFYTPRNISRMYENTLSEAQIRAACHRGPGEHPLPHIKSGATRPVIKIRPSVFEKWLNEEMGLDEPAEQVDSRAGRNLVGVRQ